MKVWVVGADFMFSISGPTRLKAGRLLGLFLLNTTSEGVIGLVCQFLEEKKKIEKVGIIGVGGGVCVCVCVCYTHTCVGSCNSIEYDWGSKTLHKKSF